MKKVERINIIMRYINNRAHFTISELMQAFDISRSTAIRDIKEIEAMGMPLTSEIGRDGGYFVMHNSLLPEVRFTDNEVKALFIAFMASKNQQLPYLKSRQSLAEKLLGLISENQQDDLILLNQMLLFEVTNPHNPDLLDLSDIPHPMLEKLILNLLSDRYVMLLLEESPEPKLYHIYVFHLWHEKRFWTVEGFDMEEKKKKMIPIDTIIDIMPESSKKNLTVKEILETLGKQEGATNVFLELGPNAIIQFKKYHPLKISLSYTNPYQTTAHLRTYINVDNRDEVAEITNWLLFLGEDIIVNEAPEVILNILQERIKAFSSRS